MSRFPCGCARKEVDIAQRAAQIIMGTLRELGYQLNPGSIVLDFGCGKGWLTYQLRKKGIEAFGVDVNRYWKSEGPRNISEHAIVEELCRQEKLCEVDEMIFRTINLDNYRIPFDDNTFDAVISTEVFEHVRNYTQTLAEIKRITKPGGCNLHWFPSRSVPIEPHIFVPLASVIRTRSWLRLWALLGIRNSFQKGMQWREVADANFRYLRSSTTYHSKEKIKGLIAAQFGNISFVESVAIRQFPRVRRSKLLFAASKLPLIPFLYSTFQERFVFFTKPEQRPVLASAHLSETQPR